MLRTLRRALLPALIVSALSATLAWAVHTHLTKATPTIDGTIATAPTDLVLWFNERPDVALSNVRLRAPDSTMIPLGATRAAEDTLALTAQLRGTLTVPGVYTVLWRTAGADGHVMRGSYKFTFQP
jgi:methionine-rich copper-binding protein CopC